MATRCLSRSLLVKLSLPSSLAAATTTTTTPRFSLSTYSLLRHRRLISTALFPALRQLPSVTGLRAFSSRQTSSSLSDPNPNMSNRPPKETILLDGCDFEHWLVVMEKPEGEPTREEIIDKYIKTLAVIVGSEEEARMKIYSVSTRCYFAFGALIAEEFTYKLKELPGVRWVLPDSYLDVRNKDYGGEPFINGQAVPYDPKYHEEWIRNNARAGERNRRNDRPRNSDRSRNFERRRENMENRDFSNRTLPQTSAPNMGGPPPNTMGGFQPNNVGGNPSNNMGGNPSNMDGNPSNNMDRNPFNNNLSNNMGGLPPTNNGREFPPNNMGRMPPSNSMGGPPPPNNIGRMPPPNSMGGPPLPNNMGRMPPPNMGWAPQPNMGGLPLNNMGGSPPNNMGGPPPNMGGPPPNNMGGPPLNNMGGSPPNNMGGLPLNNMGGPPPNNMAGSPPNMAGPSPNNMGGPTPNNIGGPTLTNMRGMPPSNMSGMPQAGNMPNYYQNNGGPPGQGPNSYAQDLPSAHYQR